MRWVLNLLAGVLIRRGRFGDRDAHGVGGGGRSCDAEAGTGVMWASASRDHAKL